MSALLPCPFCGSPAELLHTKTWDYFVRCTNKSCAARTRQYHENNVGAVDAWNTRAERTCRNVNKEWEKTNFEHAGTSFCCSECGAHYVDCESYYAALADANEEDIRTNYCPNCGAKVVER